MKEHFEIIDFHTHPFLSVEYSICWHNEYCNFSPNQTLKTLQSLGVKKICGSVLSNEVCEKGRGWELVSKWNNHALQVKERYGDFYEMGFHVHPDFVSESLEEIDRMAERGVKLVGELVPAMTGYSGFAVAGDEKNNRLRDAKEYDYQLAYHRKRGYGAIRFLVSRHENRSGAPWGI